MNEQRTIEINGQKVMAEVVANVERFEFPILKYEIDGETRYNVMGLDVCGDETELLTDEIITDYKDSEAGFLFIKTENGWDVLDMKDGIVFGDTGWLKCPKYLGVKADRYVYYETEDRDGLVLLELDEVNELWDVINEAE